MIFTEQITEGWDAFCSSRGDLFNSSAWHSVLSDGFDSKTLYGCDEQGAPCVSITIFSAGPFRIGYLGFPVGGAVGGFSLSPEVLSSLRTSRFPSKLHCVRIPVSAFVEQPELPPNAQTAQETAILDLQGWNPQKETKLRQRVNRALRSPLEIIDASDVAQGNSLFSLYRDTVFRHGGSLKYTSAYFRALIKLSKASGKIRCLLAMLDEQFVGFEVVACHGQTGYSLHGCTNPEYKKYSTSDLLTYSAVSWAREQGMLSYNFMSSPQERKSLVRYKEKWGGVTRQHKTYELVLKPISTAVFNRVFVLYHKMPNFIKLAWRR